MTRASSSRRRAVVVASVGVAAALAFAPSAAQAHDYVLSSDPAAGSTISAPIDSASITFSDVVLDLSGTGSSNVLEVTDAAGRHYEDGCSTTSGPVLTSGVALGGAGDYTMTYQAVSADGHTVSDTIPFTYAPPAGTTGSAGSAERPACDASGGADEADGTAPAPGATAGAEQSILPAEPGDAASATSTEADASDGDQGNLGVVVGIAVGIVVLALVAVAVVLVTSRRRPRAEAGDDASDGPAPGSGGD